MPESQYTTTDSLPRLIDALQLGRKTGRLQVARGQGRQYEEGSITFVAGQMVQASIGRLSGAAALHTLQRWSACTFLFEPTLPAEYIESSSAGRNVRASHRSSLTTDESGVIDPSSPYLAVPYPLRDMQSALHTIEQRGFSRLHRQVFLLLDGRRTVSELITIMGRSPQEVFLCLDQLTQAGLIHV